jgi:glucose-6-phosphate 1-dehydrogenase
VADSRLQTIAYPSPSSRPFRRDLDPLAPHVIVLFGATGDLSKRKLLPGLAYLAESALAPDIRVVGTAMEDISSDEFRALKRPGFRAHPVMCVVPPGWRLRLQRSRRLRLRPVGCGRGGA